MTFLELQKQFPDEKSIISYFLNIRYPNGVTCKHCDSEKVYQVSTNLKVFICRSCHSSFSPFANTIFEHSSTDLRKWFYAIHLFLNGKKGISGLQLQREIGVTYKTAWRMLQQIRTAMGNAQIENQNYFDAIIEIDETYIGGKPRKDNKHDKDDNDQTPTINKRGRGTKKNPVVGVIDRANKIIYAKVALPNSQNQKLTGRQLFNVLKQACKNSNPDIVISDEFRGYNTFDNKDFIHLRVDHQQMFANGAIHTNNIESFWATLKRGIYGIYHHVSLKYLQNYVNEFCFRYNNRKNDMFVMVLKQGIA
jgi:transposase-like protein